MPTCLTSRRSSSRPSSRVASASSSRSPRSGGAFDIDTLRKRVALLDEDSQRPSFWDHPRAAQATLQERNALIARADTWDALLQRAKDLSDYLELARESADPSFIEDLGADYKALNEDFAREESKNLLAGEADRLSAIVSVQAGAGGVDAMDWCRMVARMLERYAERMGWKVTTLDLHEGEEAGTKSVTYRIEGEYAYGYLKSERGVHRLVRLSPFDSAHRRHTAFASVDVAPVVDDTIDIQIREDDLRIDTFRSSSAGGQHVNVTDSAIRITHFPSGLVVSCQNQRSQHQNKAEALRVLKSRLYELELEKREQESATARGLLGQITFGQQIRSYVFHPYTQVKDKRTGHEVSNVESVIDGNLDGFVNAYLHHQMEGGEYLEESDDS